jgi:hypothetical protein
VLVLACYDDDDNGNDGDVISSSLCHSSHVGMRCKMSVSGDDSIITNARQDEARQGKMQHETSHAPQSKQHCSTGLAISYAMWR